MANKINSLLSNITGHKIIMPVYHAIANRSPIHLKHLYRVRSIEEFEKDLDFLLKNYHPISITELLNRVETGKKSKSNEFILTFDDGLREIYDVVRPVLLSKGIPALVFLNPGFIDNKALMYRYKASILLDNLLTGKASPSLSTEIKVVLNINGSDPRSVKKSILGLGYSDTKKFENIANLLNVDFKEYLKNNKPYLDIKQINKMIEDGFIFGGHSIDHPDYSNLSLEMQLRQTFQSVEMVKRRTDQKYGLFAFPFTDFGISRMFFDKMYASMEPEIHASFGTAGIKKDSYPQHFQRIPVENYDGSLSSTLLHEYLYYLIKVPFRKNQIIRR